MVAVVTNIDREHLDHFGTEQALADAFLDFADRVPFYGLVVLGAGSPMAAALGPRLLRRHVTYGLRSGDYRGEVLDARPDGTHVPTFGSFADVNSCVHVSPNSSRQLH